MKIEGIGGSEGAKARRIMMIQQQSLQSSNSKSNFTPNQNPPHAEAPQALDKQVHLRDPLSSDVQVSLVKADKLQMAKVEHEIHTFTVHEEHLLGAEKKVRDMQQVTNAKEDERIARSADAPDTHADESVIIKQTSPDKFHDQQGYMPKLADADLTSSHEIEPDKFADTPNQQKDEDEEKDDDEDEKATEEESIDEDDMSQYRPEKDHQ